MTKAGKSCNPFEWLKLSYDGIILQDSIYTVMWLCLLHMPAMLLIFGAVEI